MKTTKVVLIKKSHMLVSFSIALLEQATMALSNDPHRKEVDDLLVRAEKSAIEYNMILNSLVLLMDKRYNKAEVDIPSHLKWIYEIDLPPK